MARRRSTTSKKNTTAANVGYEAQLWQMADALRGNMDAAEYKHVTLGLIFLKYISDAFEEQHMRLKAEKGQGADPVPKTASPSNPWRCPVGGTAQIGRSEISRAA